MKTAVPEQTRQQAYTTYVILSIGLVFMLMSLALSLVMIAAPQKTAVSATPAPPVEIIHTSIDPVQTAVNVKTITWQREDYTWKLTPRAQIQIVGRVLSRQTYSRDWQSEISPLDLAIGWGELNDTKVDKWVRWQQSSRWYYYRWPDEAPYDEKYLRTHSSNIHIIPATESLETALLKIDEDDTITLEGKLVDIEATSETRRWLSKTSLTRTDSGNGACEILLVERLIWNGQTYQ
ncbi:MAG: hypothetical protein IAF02_06120 [Anaerolineae bacterium]|nr:hypothetical protein [Anaerolineae bacterium]